MKRAMTSRADGDEIQFSIISALAARVLVVDL
jgi:hypothetical protein